AASIWSTSVESTRPRVSEPAITTALAKRAISGLTGTTRRGSPFRLESSLCGEKREKRSCQARRLRRACRAASRAERSGAAPMRSSAQEEPKQSKVSTRSEEHTSELQSPYDLVCRLLLEKKKKK